MATKPLDDNVIGLRARYTYRLRLSSTALAGLEAEWSRCRWVWNECVSMSRRVHALDKDAEQKIRCGPARLDEMPAQTRQSVAWLREGASVPQQQTIRDFAKSRAKAVKDIKARLPLRQRAGMPGIKRKREAVPSLNSTRRGFSIKDGRLHLAGGIVLTVVWSRDLPSDPTSVRVYRDSLGHWYASFAVTAETQPLPETRAVIGVDRGMKETATTTCDAHGLPHAEHGKKATARPTRCQRMTARRATPENRPDSAGYRKARKAADAAIGATKTALIEQAHKHGRKLHLVHPAHTTMDCARCGARTKHALPLSERTYTC
ncbi:RNA-guided endonuclease InsQ/TnpB family protein, partial [Streptomyces sp. NPDC059355]|uniref:RNA-guided endonuclease InsQ/TnpB family protein n=1 Tax=Streptomyces sp. NPDC059355 TaxID=3346811 RepID=UPI00367C6EEE